MYEEYSAPLPDAKRYLERIGLAGYAPESSAADLNALVYAHLTHVPFENFDVWASGKNPDLGVKALFEKVVTKRCGGYCFELNGLFYSLLRALGFETYCVAVRLMRNRDYLAPISHRGSVCVIDGEKYYCDVGYGGPSPRSAIKLSGEMTPDGFFATHEGAGYAIWQRVSGEAIKTMVFMDVPFQPVDFVPLSFYVSQRPGANPFRTRLSASVMTPDGRRQLADTALVTTYADGTEAQLCVKSAPELEKLLLEKFGLSYKIDRPERLF